MRYIATILLLALAGCASTAPAQPEATTIKLTADQVALCKAQGGCALFTEFFFEMEKARAYRASRQTCGKEQAL